MLSVEAFLAAILLAIVSCYVIVAGSELGAAVWYLLAAGSRADHQRQLTAWRIGPAVEGHHVWLLLIAVVLCAAFPVAFGRIFVALLVPVLGVLCAVAARVVLLAWRLTVRAGARRLRLVNTLLAACSLLPPFLLSMGVAALSMGHLESPWDGSGRPWLTPFPFAVGMLGLSLFAMLSALTLFLEAPHKPLREDFRRRAFAAVILANACAMIALALARDEAPIIWRGLTQSSMGWTLIGTEAVLVALTLFCLIKREAAGARHIGMASVVVLIIGWAYAQYPFLLAPEISIYNSAAPGWSLRYLVAVLASAAILFPFLYYVYRLFKGGLTLRKV